MLRSKLAPWVASFLVLSCTSAPAASPAASGGGSPSPSAAPSTTPSRAVPQASASASPSPTVSLPTPMATTPPSIAPTPPPGALARTATIEQDGVRVKIELERNPMPALEWTRVRTTVRNLGDSVLHWFSDGCETPVHVRGEMDVDWRPGVAQSGIAATFKDRVLHLAYRATPAPGPIVHFDPKKLVNQGYGCADVGITHDIAPGRAVHDERVWGGQAALRWGPPPTGPITITGSFTAFWRGRSMPDYPDWPRIEVKLHTWVSGGADETWLSPPEVVDAALADAAFVEYLRTQDLGSGRDEILWYEPELGAWEVGILAWYDDPDPTMHLVLVDPHSGAILDTVDRPWDEDRDGMP